MVAAFYRLANFLIKSTSIETDTDWRMPVDLVQYGVINDLVLLSTVGILPVLVHGGGPEINTWLKKVGIESKFDPESGLRVTDGTPSLSCF